MGALADLEAHIVQLSAAARTGPRSELPERSLEAFTLLCPLLTPIAVPAPTGDPALDLASAALHAAAVFLPAPPPPQLSTIEREDEARCALASYQAQLAEYTRHREALACDPRLRALVAERLAHHLGSQAPGLPGA